MFTQSKGMRSYGRYGAVGLELIISIAVGYYIGHWMDTKFGTRWLSLVGFLLGCYTGFRVLFRAAKTMQRDIEREERLERGEDPWAEETDDEASARTTHDARSAPRARGRQPTSKSDP